MCHGVCRSTLCSRTAIRGKRKGELWREKKYLEGEISEPFLIVNFRIKYLFKRTITENFNMKILGLQLKNVLLISLNSRTHLGRGREGERERERERERAGKYFRK